MSNNAQQELLDRLVDIVNNGTENSNNTVDIMQALKEFIGTSEPAFDDARLDELRKIITGTRKAYEITDGEPFPDILAEEFCINMVPTISGHSDIEFVKPGQPPQPVSRRQTLVFPLWIGTFIVHFPRDDANSQSASKEHEHQKHDSHSHGEHHHSHHSEEDHYKLIFISRIVDESRYFCFELVHESMLSIPIDASASSLLDPSIFHPGSHHGTGKD